MPEENVVANSNVGKRQQVKSDFQIAQSFYNMIVFSAGSRAEWLLFFEKGIGLFLHASSFLGIIFFKTGLYTYDLIVSKNKNLGKVMSFLREIAATILLLVAIFGGLATSVTMALAVPWLYVASLGVNLLYNLCITIQNAYQWAQCTNRDLKQKYKESFIKHFVTTIIVGLLTTALTFFMALKIVPTAMAIVSACIHGGCFALGVYGAYKKHHSTKSTSPTIKHEAVIQDLSSEPVRHAIASPINSNENDSYFYQKNYSEELLWEYHPANYLILQITDKIALLHSELNQDQNKFFNQKNKRLAKIEVLEKLKLLISDQDKTQEDFYALLKHPLFNKKMNNPFQSFFRQEGATEGLFKAAENYYSELYVPPVAVKFRRQS